MAGLIALVSDIVDKWRIVRRSVVYFSLALTWWVTDACIDIGTRADAGSDEAMIIAALMAPVTLLLGAVTQFYMGGRRDVELG